MILKWLITGFIVYMVVRWIVKPNRLGTSQKERRKVKQQEANPKEGEYIDYEEVD